MNSSPTLLALRKDNHRMAVLKTSVVYIMLTIINITPRFPALREMITKWQDWTVQYLDFETVGAAR